MQKELKIIKDVSIPEAEITLREDGIVYTRYNDGTELNIPLQMKMLDIYNELTNFELKPFLIQADTSVIVTKEARDNAIKIEESAPMKAVAVVVKNVAQALIANFYIKFNKPKRPYKVFNKQEDALEWLKQYL